LYCFVFTIKEKIDAEWAHDVYFCKKTPMNIRKSAKYISIGFTILLADVIKELILHKIGWKKDFAHPYKSTLIGMLVTVAIYYPAFSILEEWIEKGIGFYMSKTKKSAGGGVGGLMVAFAIGVAILFVVYVKLWFNKSVL